MSISRDELLNILSVVSFLGHYEREMHAAEKKVLMAIFKAASITHAVSYTHLTLPTKRIV